MSDLAYYETLEDYEDIKDYLDLSPVEDSINDDQFPPFVPDFSSAIIVDNIPAVPREKIAKLISVLVRVYAQIAPITEADIEMPFDDATGLTCGFCFIKFKSKEDAEKAVTVTQGFAIDKKHSFVVNLYSDLDKYQKLPDEYTPQTPPPFRPRPDPTSWLTDPKCRDQFVIRAAHDTEIFWANTTVGEEPSLVYGGEREKVGGKVWCESYVRWSPQGTYLATFHAPGIKLWGSADFQPQGRYMHDKVEELSFSPCENYLVTYRYAFHPKLNPAEAIIVWDIRSGSKLRTFELKNPLDVKFQVNAMVVEEKAGKRVERVARGRVKAYEGDSSGGYFTIEEGTTVHVDIPSDKVAPLQEPNRLKWSADGKYLARLGCDIISVYELPSMTLVDKKSIAAKEVLEFSWSPDSNMISYWSPASGNYPAQINVIKVPERTEICSRKIFEVSDGKMVWQNEGDYLCVHMTKMQGKKRSFVLYFFRISKPGVPVEQLELADPILSVSWEPSGDRVIITHGEARSPSVSFYSMKAASGGKDELSLLFTKTGSQCNQVFWSPAGGKVALAYFASDACVFELMDVDNNVSLATRRHDRCTRLFWDPSGRYVATCTVVDLRNAQFKGNLEDGYNIYTFQGTMICSVKREKLFQFAWRPRPKGLLSAEEKKKVIKNLRKYEKLFERDDKLRKQELDQEVQAARYLQAETFLTWMNRNRSLSAAMKPRRIALRNGYDSDDERNYKIEVTLDETVISTKEQILH